MKTALALLLVGGIAVHQTNSHAASKRGMREYEAKQYAAAATAFGAAHGIDPTPRTAFNAATAAIAAGQHEEGSALMEEAIRDPKLRADAWFNRGNSAMAANALDHAIRDYQDALRARPDFAAAKRNLEIALTRRQSQQKSRSGQEGGQGGQQQQQQQKPAPSQGQKQEPKQGQTDLEALLRSVQQQEQEELSRMKKLPADRRVGW
ncbi:MAG TPA: tetratricopeptide repeat protein [Thermoanaerobaculia bacterium]